MHRRAEIVRKVASSVGQSISIWLVHVEIMGKNHMASRVLIAEVSGVRVRGRPRLGWMDGVKVPTQLKIKAA